MFIDLKPHITGGACMYASLLGWSVLSIPISPVLPYQHTSPGHGLSKYFSLFLHFSFSRGPLFNSQ